MSKSLSLSSSSSWLDTLLMINGFDNVKEKSLWKWIRDRYHHRPTHNKWLTNIYRDANKYKYRFPNLFHDNNLNNLFINLLKNIKNYDEDMDLYNILFIIRYLYIIDKYSHI